MKHHPISDVWPMMDDSQLAELAEDIKRNGQINPIWLFEGMILDGRNRWRACEIAGVTPATKTYTGDEPTAFAVAMNDRRRHMNKGALSAVAVELEPFFAEDAKRRQAAQALRNQPQAQRDISSISLFQNEEKIPHSEATPRQPQRNPQARSEAAKAVGVNDRYVQDAKKVKQEAPEVFERLKAGKITMQDAKREVAKKPQDDWRADERARQAMVQAGKTVIANAQADKNLISWAEGAGRATYVNRGTKFGNPFILGDDGDRDTVCNAYRDAYLPNKPSIQRALKSIQGTVLICHCYPERCHAESLVLDSGK